jgi:predicted GNAT family N-acyltransferase
MSNSVRCQAKNPSACVDPQCPEKRNVNAKLASAVASNDFDAYLKAKTPKKVSEVKNPTDFVSMVKAAHPEVKLYISGNTDNYVVLDLIVIPKELRKMGLATKIMGQLVEAADKNNWPLALTPSNDFGSSTNRLEVFYRRFGFVKNAGRNKDYAIMQTMIRPVN